MRTVIVVASAYGAQFIQRLGGQAELVKIVQESGADGIEIRQELLVDASELKTLAVLIRNAKLISVYSSPSPLFDERGRLNETALRQRLDEAVMLGAVFLKLPLGGYRNDSDLVALGSLLQGIPLQLLVENDQTVEGGILAPLVQFFTRVTQFGVPLKMTFDMANWHWLDEDAPKAATQLGCFVDYIHVKASRVTDGLVMAIALDDAGPDWKMLLEQLPTSAPLGIEFPLTGTDLVGVTRHYVQLLKEA
ncbi:sugar phosphate isomerase/epimerase family protein [Celerinatantimonas sp. YJH-8]|uniref:sugar phosphate isomerase/epimerase family protein n=1 Tax=Celerinatantimonas sp. YJH-8 TaxID=3228714 RepID=UPI0038C2058E